MPAEQKDRDRLVERPDSPKGTPVRPSEATSTAPVRDIDAGARQLQDERQKSLDKTGKPEASSIPDKRSEGEMRRLGVDTGTPTNTRPFEDRVLAEDTIRDAAGGESARERADKKDQRRTDALQAASEERDEQAKQDADETKKLAKEQEKEDKAEAKKSDEKT